MTRSPPGGSTSPTEAFRIMGILFVIVLLLPAAPVAGQVDSTGEQDVIYLTERPFQDGTDRWNFTVFPADENQSSVQRQAEQRAFPTFRADWTWYLPSALTNWSIASGTRWQLHLHISGLDEVHPVPTFSSLSSGTAGHQIQVEVRKGDDVLSQASTVVPFVEVQPGVQRYRVDLDFEGPVDFTVDDDVPSLRFEISVSGRGTEPESPLYAHFGSVDHPSRLVAADYPIDTFRALEVAYLLEKECTELILQQRSCEALQSQGRETDDGIPGDDPDTSGEEEENGDELDGQQEKEDEEEPTPGPPGVLLISGLISYILVRRRRKRS